MKIEKVEENCTEERSKQEPGFNNRRCQVLGMNEKNIAVENPMRVSVVEHMHMPYTKYRDRDSMYNALRGEQNR